MPSSKRNILTLQKSKAVTIGYTAAFLSALLVGSISTVSKPVLSNVSPLLYASVVYLLAAGISTPLAHKASIFSIRKKDWLLILAISSLGSILAPALFFVGLQQTSASDTAILSNGETVFTVLLALALFKERLRPSGYVAVALVLCGVVIVTTNLQFSNFLTDIKKEGNLLVLTSMALWAMDNNLSKIITQRVDVSRVVQLKTLIGGAVLLLIVISLRIPINISLSEIPNILLVGIVGFGLSLYFFLHGLKRVGTVRTMLIYSTSSIIGLIFASLFLHEEIGAYQILAIAAMLCGIYIIARDKQNIEKTTKLDV